MTHHLIQRQWNRFTLLGGVKNALSYFKHIPLNNESHFESRWHLIVGERLLLLVAGVTILSVNKPLNSMIKFFQYVITFLECYKED